MGQVKHVLWTGGWDSTFRVIQLYNRDITLQPIYIIDPSRKSTKKEIETIKLLTSQIQERFKNSNGKILPVNLINRKDIPSNLYIKFMYKLVKKQRKIGTQYKWLGYLSKHYDHLEQCFHKEDRDQLIMFDELTEIKDETGGRNWVVNPKKMGFLKRQIFKNIRFPLMYISKLEMKAYAEAHNFIDIMNNTWFCHRSGNKPCGKCTPCKQYIIDGLEHRLY